MNETASISPNRLQMWVVGLLWLAAQILIVGASIAAAGGPTGVVDWVKAHPLEAAGIGAGWQVVVFAAGVLAKVWKRLEPEVVEGLAEGVRARYFALGEFVSKVKSRFRRRYLEQVVFEHRDLNFRGLKEQGSYTLEVEHVFIELKISPNHTKNISPHPLAKPSTPDSRQIWTFIRYVAERKGVGLAVLGAPGSGKTTLLQNVALTFAKNRQRKHKLRNYLPLMLFLRSHVETIINEKPVLGALAQTYFGKRFGRIATMPVLPKEWFEDHLANGKCIVLLDGLDEVADKEHRKAVASWVDEQIRTYPRSPFVITARPGGYKEAPLSRVDVLEVQAFNLEQVKNFIHSWYLAHETMRKAGLVDEGVRLKAHESAEDLLERLYRLQQVFELTCNPLLLTMIAAVHSARNVIPERRVELYSEICNVMLGHWNTAKGLKAPLSMPQLRAVLEPLAAQMMKMGKRELSHDEVLDAIVIHLASVGYPRDQREEFLPMLEKSSGLFLERENGHWAFAHLSFQEYLSAAYYHAKPGKLDFEKVVSEPWWHETLKLYAAMTDATELVQACSDANDLPARALMHECLSMARSVEPGTRAIAEEKLRNDLESKDPELRRLAAEAKLITRIRGLQSLKVGSTIDDEYLSMAEYQMFIDDQRQKGIYRQPDHWDDMEFPRNHSEFPVTGVRPEDVHAFFEWLNDTDGHKFYRYRPPTQAEVIASPLKTKRRMVVWCNNTGNIDGFFTFPSEPENLYRPPIQNDSDLPAHSLLPPCQRSTFDFNFDLQTMRVFDIARTRAKDFSHIEKVIKDFTNALNAASKFFLRDSKTHRKTDTDQHFYSDTFLPIPQRTLVTARDLVTLVHLDDELMTAFQRRDYTYATIRAGVIAEDRQNPNRRAARLIENILKLIQAQSVKDRRIALLHYTARLIEYTWLYGNGHSFEPRKHAQYTPEQSATLIAGHHWLKLTAARLEGKIPPFEGIRIVRERIKKTS